MPIARLSSSLAREASREHRRDPRDSSKATVSAALRSNERYHAQAAPSEAWGRPRMVGASIEMSTHRRSAARPRAEGQR